MVILGQQSSKIWSESMGIEDGGLLSLRIKEVSVSVSV